MGIQANLSDNISTRNEIDAYAMTELHGAMLRLWDKLKDLASSREPSPVEVNYAIEEFSISWQMIAGLQIDDDPRKESMPETFARMLFKRLRLQYLEFQKKHG
jgi:hypothetical protein